MKRSNAIETFSIAANKIFHAINFYLLRSNFCPLSFRYDTKLIEYKANRVHIQLPH